MGLVDYLIQRGALSPAQRERVLALTAERKESEPVILTRLGLVSEREMAAALADHLDLKLADPAAFPERPLLAERIAPGFLQRSRVLPIAEGSDRLVLAMADPTDAAAVEAVRLLVGKPIERRVACPSDIDLALARLYGGGRPLDPIVAEAHEQTTLVDPGDRERLQDLASDEPVIRLVNGLITRAVQARASDIHLESFEGRFLQRWRIDGVLAEVEPPPARLKANIVSRIKIMAALNIAERRLPQDGRCRITVEGREIDIRVSIVPTIHGESVVLRLLDRGRAPLAFPELGFARAIEVRLIDLLDLPNGILLVTGPTGSGKTSTLYAALQRLNQPSRKILTVEDPVEYQLPGVNQIPVRPAIGLGFANILRSLLRQDPDVLMIGEIRDLETARIAVQAALTGHLVLSTVHTNDAPSTINRLLDMGVEDYLLASALRGILGQRLVRCLCPACREPYRPPPELARSTGLDRLAPAAELTLYRSRGCPACGGTGYHGRTVIAELMVLTDSLRRLILARPDAGALAAAAREEGMVEMRRDGLAKALAGVTTLEEVLRASGLA